MHRIALKTFEKLQFAGMPTYRELLKAIINKPLNIQRGFDADDMRRSIKLLDKFEAADGVLDLEDAEWDIVKAKVAAFPFAIAHKELLAFIDAVNDAPEVKQGEK